MQVLESRSDSDDVISLISFQLQSDLKQYPLTITTHVTLMQLSLVYPPSAWILLAISVSLSSSSCNLFNLSLSTLILFISSLSASVFDAAAAEPVTETESPASTLESDAYETEESVFECPIALCPSIDIVESRVANPDSCAGVETGTTSFSL